ncbi:MAG: polysaccharide biosynthesis protein [Williamsia sp.]|nr:polysaccharide biosynthesis protein [Williamsia sp.]
MWYGVSSIGARFITYLLTPYLTDVLTKADYGKMGLVYAAIPLLNVLFTYGMETTYFRFAQQENRRVLYNTVSISLLISTFFFTGILWLFRHELAVFAGLPDYPELIKISIFIIALDTLTRMPLSKLRQEGRPVRFAVVNVAVVLVNIGLTFFFLTYCRKALATDANSWVRLIYNPHLNPIVYVLIANLAQSVCMLLLLWKEFTSFEWKFDLSLWRTMMVYSMPLIVAGLGGMINETFDRLMLKWLVPGSNTYKEVQVGVYNACYKLSILITLFVQAFRMGAEPFFFKQAGTQNQRYTYARVMKFFVITITVMFLVVSLFLVIWRYFIASKHWEGLRVVPILLLANMFLGIYYNLSIWYKLGHKTGAGATITLIGAAITLLVNGLFIPSYGYMACAWATFFCYGSMMVISYVWGQKRYPVPYAWKKLLAYIVIVVLLYFVHRAINYFVTNDILSIVSGGLLLGAYMMFILRVERNEFRKLPVIGKYV